MDLGSALTAELQRRRTRNPRYSLRAFARDLGLDHGTLSQLVRQKRTLTASMVRRLAHQLGLEPVQIDEICVAQDAFAIARLIAVPGFRTHTRWIAQRTGIAMDNVNIALHWLLRTDHLIMRGPDRWILKNHLHA